MGFMDKVVAPYNAQKALDASVAAGTTKPNSSLYNGEQLPYWFNFGKGNSAYPGLGPGSTLFNLLQNPGQTDSTMVNRAISANARGTQSAQTAARGNVARSGFGTSGLGQALQGAIGQAGQNRETDIRLGEARRKEDLTRQDLGLLLDFIIHPELTTYGANKGVSVAESAQKSAKQGAAIGGGASLLATLIPILAAACRTAEELYGLDDERTHLARFYMGTLADPETRVAYGSGAELAERVKHDPELRAEVKTIFDGFVEEARTTLRGTWQG